jgi:hypothetical protein
MVVGDLVDYLRQHLQLGYDIHELKLQLVRFGHSPKMVEEALEVVRKDALEGLPAPPLPLHVPSKAHVWLLTPALLFVMLFSIGVIVALLRNSAI